MEILRSMLNCGINRVSRLLKQIYIVNIYDKTSIGLYFCYGPNKMKLAQTNAAYTHRVPTLDARDVTNRSKRSEDKTRKRRYQNNVFRNKFPILEQTSRVRLSFNREHVEYIITHLSTRPNYMLYRSSRDQ